MKFRTSSEKQKNEKGKDSGKKQQQKRKTLLKKKEEKEWRSKCFNFRNEGKGGESSSSGRSSAVAHSLLADVGL